VLVFGVITTIESVIIRFIDVGWDKRVKYPDEKNHPIMSHV